MTQQTEERLRYRGRTYTLREHPLADCMLPGVVARMKQLHGRSSSLWRGYLGTWEVRRGRLWLVELSATVREEPDTLGLSWLFPENAGKPVCADWYSGELRSPRGKAERVGPYRHESPYLRVFHVQAGVVLRSELRDNRQALREIRDHERRLLRHRQDA